ncbi:MAG TPA: hypothetical protein PKE59_00010 [Novosphingobium sp.]|jgi:hypothetical protein|nr:hypothetical protein [Novosphingobium sp.]
MRDHAPASGPICIYHGNCADGFTAAWVVREALGDGVEFVPGSYGLKPPNVAGRDVIMVDFSYKRPILANMAAQARSILILDHHKTAAEDLAGFPSPAAPSMDMWPWAEHFQSVLAGEVGRVPVVLFDMERSGAQIAWDFFFPGQARPLLVDYVGDRDLWRFLLPASREVAATVFSHPYDFAVWDGLADRLDGIGFGAVASEGEAILRKHDKDISELIAVTRRMMFIGGRQVPVANLPYTMASDAAHLMAEHAPFAACYFDRPDARVFSLRSREGGADVAEIAALYGGGGHKHAAGFQRPLGWAGDDCLREAPGMLGDALRALGGLIRFRNWELAEGGVTPPDLINAWKDAEAVLASGEAGR